MRIDLRVEASSFAPLRTEARRFVIIVNELGEAEIRYAGDPVVAGDKSVAMHVNGGTIVLEVEAKP